MNTQLPITQKLFSAVFALVIIVSAGIVNAVYGQTYATGATPNSGSISCALGCLSTGVINPDNAATSDNGTKATMLSQKAVLGTSGGAAFLTLRFPANVPAQQTVYVKIDAPVVTGLVTSVLSLVGLVGTNISATLRDGATTSSDGTSIAATTKIVTDVTGTNYFLAVTPNASNPTPFNAVRILVDSPALELVASSITLNVYNAFYYPSGGATDCGLPQYVSLGETTGLSLSVVTNPFTNSTNAIDGVISTRAQIGSGLANVGLFSALSQTFLFKNVQSVANQAVIYMSVGADVADVSLFTGLTVQAFLGENPIGSPASLSSLIDLTLLGYAGGLPANTVVPFYLTPGSGFDRIKITMSNTINVAVLTAGVFINDVGVVPPKPTLSSKLVYQFAGATPAVSATSSGNSIVWRGALPLTTDLAAASSSPASFPVAVSSNGDYIAVAYIPTCSTFGSDSTKLRVIVLSDASTTIPAGVQNQALASGGSIKASSSGHTFNYTATGLPAGLSFDNTTGAITGTPTETGSFDVTVTIYEGLVNTGLTLTKTISIYTPMVFGGGPFNSVNVNSASYSQGISIAASIPASGGRGASFYVYSLTPLITGGRVASPMAAPTGLAISGAGVISGDPSGVTVGDYTFPIYVNDGVQEISADFTITFFDQPLPVVLSRFEAQKEGVSVVLSWTTTEEINSEKFEIQRSREGKNWTVIGQKMTTGAGGDQYSFIDQKPINGSNIYRLKMIDWDGSFGYSHKVSVVFRDLGGRYAYPNPLGKSEELEINGGDYHGIANVQILDVSGKVVVGLKNVHAVLKAAGQLQPGIYILKTENTDGSVGSQRLIKN